MKRVKIEEFKSLKNTGKNEFALHWAAGGDPRSSHRDTWNQVLPAAWRYLWMEGYLQDVGERE